MSKTHVIDGKTFVEVERKAKVGEKVVGRLTGLYYDVLEVDFDGRIYHGQVGSVRRDNYRVLEPVDNDLFTDRLLEIISNLTRRVSSLESQLRDTQNNIERQGAEFANVKHLADSNEEDIRTLDERTQSLIPPPLKLTPAENNALDKIAETIAHELKKRGVGR